MAFCFRCVFYLHLNLSRQSKDSGKLIGWLVTPTTTKALLDAGYKVTVERSTQRIFDGMLKTKSPSMPYFEQLLTLTSNDR